MDEARDLDLYFSDGNIVLSASPHETSSEGDEQTFVITYFRVHQSILSKHSPVFKDMFAVAQPAEGLENRYNDLPLVYLHDDPTELKAFLQTFYDPGFIPEDRYDPTYAAVMLGPVKLARKYQVETLLQKVVKRLTKEWPTDLEIYDRRRDEIQESFRWRRRKDKRNNEGHYARAFDALSLVKAGDLYHQLIPQLGTIYYEAYVACCREDIDKEVGPERLSEYRGLFHAQMELRSMLYNFKFNPYRCPRGKHHDLGFQESFTMYSQQMFSRECLFVTLKRFVYMIQSGEPFFSIKKACTHCFSDIESQVEAFRRQLFAELPRIFGAERCLSSFEWESSEDEASEGDR
ncbi:hypothetical protein HGRIS_013881 [Hohenbuehelia grisea]|uniref:BTB domain-containing protein n=1 Tax=Hohenbuehelia grisea TaxID=104357 RepID=A0ABR3IX00_9AGAR